MASNGQQTTKGAMLQKLNTLQLGEIAEPVEISGGPLKRIVKRLLLAERSEAKKKL